MTHGALIRRPVGKKSAGLSVLALVAALPVTAQTINGAGIGIGGMPLIATDALPGVGVAGSGLQLPGAGLRFRVVPSLSISETITDNATLSSTDRQAEAITRLTAGVGILSTGGRVRGFFNYALTGLLYARGTSPNTLQAQNSLNTSSTTELIERHAYVDVASTISQQAVSALGTQSVDPALGTGNRTEVRTLSVSPYLRGQVPEIANYDLRATRVTTHTTSALVSNTTTTLLSAGLTGVGTRRLNWAANASRQIYDYSAGRRTESDRVNGLLLLTVDPQLRFTLNAGREASNFSTLDKESRAIYGLRMDWLPSMRTSVVAEVQQRFFGKAHTFSLSHRTPRSAWIYSDTKDVSATGPNAGVGVQGTLFDLFYNAFASREPDPVARTTLVNAFLLSNGINPVTPVTTGFLASSATVRRLQSLSFTLLGIRDTLTFSANRSDAQRIDTVVRTNDDFSTFGRLVQQGFGVNYLHRLTPQSNFVLALTQQRNAGAGSTVSASQSTTLRSATATVSGLVGYRLRGSVSARHSRFDSATSPYHESAVIATLSLQF